MVVSSIRRFLLVGLLLTLILADGLMTLWSYYRSRYEAEELQDAQLVQYARSLSQLVKTDTRQDTVITVPFRALPEHWQGESGSPWGHKYEAKLFFQIFSDQLKLLAQADSSPDFALTSPVEGFRTLQTHGHDWRLFTLYEPESKRWIITAQRDDIRSEMGQVIALQGTLPFLFILPMAFVLICCLVSKGLQPLTRLARELEQREASDLRTIETEQTARELVPLTSAINRLLTRLSGAFARERRFTGDAAHELRTPLAGMGIHLQNACHSQGREQQDALDMALQGHRRLVHLVEQLLVLAKTSPESYLARFQPLDLKPLCQRVIAANIRLMLDKQQTISLEDNGAVTVQGDATGLEIMLSNLVRNAALYTPESGVIQISAITDAGRPMLIVEDSGPGIPEPERARVFDRFYRTGGDRHQSGTAGSGLGLSIVAHIIQLHSAEIVLGESELGGLKVTVMFQEL